MSVPSFDDWMTAFAVAPWGDERADLRMARLCRTILMPHSKRRHSESDFLFEFIEPEPLSPEKYKEKAMAHYAVIAQRMNNAAQQQKALPNG
ncbi:MAG TPA: hypothetical protein VGN72_07570 [Tepidisphaeraceae bacterium]|nr:hypothetical protein [Tepidisphaeraceae bacterium]